MGRGLDDLEFAYDRFANTGNSLELIRRGRDHGVEVPELVEQLPCQRLHVAARNGPEQNQLQHLVIGQRLCAAGQETITQSLAVVTNVRGLFAGDKRFGHDRLITGKKRERFF